MKKPYKYSGLLGEAAPLRFTSEVAEERAEEFREWYISRMRALFKDCKVDMGARDGWAQIAVVLMERHVPGFQTEIIKGRGAPRKNTLKDDVDVFYGIVRRVAAGQTQGQAALALAKERNKGEDPDNLARRYRRVLTEGGRIALLRRDEKRQKSE
jgi:hypothetical protein